MKKYLSPLKKMGKIINTRLGFVLVLLFFYWIKSLWAYSVDFNLDLENTAQTIVAIFNPLPLGLLLLGLPLYFKKSKIFYPLEILIYLILNILIISNAIYFREFTDFITVNTLIASSKSAAGLGDTAGNLVELTDLFFLIDLLVFIPLLFFKKMKSDKRPFNKRASFAVTALSALLFSANLFVAETIRPQLLTRGFANYYVVRGIGLPAFMTYSANQTYQAHRERSVATADDLKTVEAYVKKNYAAPNSKYFGIAKGRNVIVIHLESFQQFLLDYKLKSDDKEYEVTPFLNSLYHSKSSIAFSNFFNQVKNGKTSDAETMMENSLYGLNNGSYMVNYGGDNTAYATPSILAQKGGYTSAVFHGNTGSFWNRNNTYKQWGYNYFFDSTYFEKQDDENSFQYGLNDKYLFKDSIKYLEQMQQPFYAKFITVSNHYPYTSLNGDKKELGFPLADTKDDTVNGYFATANYLDSALKSFFDYLKATGLYDKSIIVLYGDHYGISNDRNTSLAPLLGKDAETWSDYDNAMMQKVPYIINIPGYTDGFISNTYGGEIDSLPTLLHLLGIDTKGYLQMGQDLLSPQNDNFVPLRTSGYYITPTYTSYGGKTYYTQNGQEITEPNAQTKADLDKLKDAAAAQLSNSDAIQTGDLLRFATIPGLSKTDSSQYNYNGALKQMEKISKNKGDKSTSLYHKKGDQSTEDLYQAKSYEEIHGSSDSSSSSSK
ncbi:LTA synthase family protein [Streptococcus sobrinus]|uniref:LTA synthase family protein n=3 Tax=Streptococcus sobrinus TaxID=1310 RepID=UPI0002D39A96|nr:LTA synthase family protein [Streptococcus sobrinus]